METLQNHFTTVDQSKRLLAVGLPADSADCYFLPFGKGYIHLFAPGYMSYSDYKAYHSDDITPVWSVGRLIEILIICGNYFAPKEFKIEPNSMKPSLIENIVDKIEELEGYDRMDFSKLS